MKKNQKTFAIIALGFLGDTLLTEPLCRNIKNNFPDSKIIFIVNKIFADIPYGFSCVDKVYEYDKKGKNKGLLGYFRFLNDFEYKSNIDYAIITHPHERSIILSKVIGAKNIISLTNRKSPLNIFVNKKRKYVEDEIRNTYKADYNSDYLKPFCKPKKLDVEYKRDDIKREDIIKQYNLPEDYIVLSPVSKDLVKDWDYENIKLFIQNADKKVVLVGTDKAAKVAQQLKSDNIDFIDITNQTTILSLGGVIKNSSACVSVDTGTFHFSYAQQVKTIGLFFNEKMIVEWAPQNLDYVKILSGKKYLKDGDIICEKNISYQDVLKEL